MEILFSLKHKVNGTTVNKKFELKEASNQVNSTLSIISAPLAETNKKTDGIEKSLQNFYVH